MSQRLRMLINNKWDTATLAVSKGGAVANLPITHSQKYSKSQTAAMTPDSQHQSQITFDLDSLSLVSGLVMYRHWLSNKSTWHLELFSEPNLQGQKVYDSQDQELIRTKTLGELDWLTDTLVASAMDAWPDKFSQLWFSPVFAFSGRITLTDSGAREGLHEFDRVYLGNVIQPKVNFDYNHQHLWTTTAQSKTTAGGSDYGSEKPVKRQFNFNLNFISEEERPHFSEAIRKVSTTKDWFISMFPEQGGIKELEYAMACKFITLPPMSHSFHRNYSIPINVKEA